ncbi:phytanoyl-CoA dioxygenase family protein [Gracilimonas tropica]|uniref:phytanoyl-CoA dioxygenase family protein n=1 Tax=Gracilimonas tropica TaxID=454600 RepID=UPI000364DC5F|nr:phytanoyl-CoA dioxygenase family protein [Gracilimonas tropica]
MKYFISEIKYKLNEFLQANPEGSIYKDVKKNGLSLLEGFLTEKKCEKLKNSFDKTLEQNSELFWKDNTDSDVRFFGIDLLNDDFKELFQDDRLTEVFKKYIDQFKRYRFIMANRTKFVPGNEGSGGGWHRDSINRRQLKYIVYLNDVTEYNGAFEYLAGTHNASDKFKINNYLGISKSETRYKDDEINKVKEKFPEYKSVICEAKKGSVIVVDTSGIHRGRPLNEGHRYAITQYMSDTEISDGLKKQIKLEVENKYYLDKFAKN